SKQRSSVWPKMLRRAPQNKDVNLMPKTILVTGATDGIGLETAKKLVSAGHHVLVHGRNPAKLDAAQKLLAALPGDGTTQAYLADVSKMAEVSDLAEQVSGQHDRLNVVINNAGVYKMPNPITDDGFDARFVVNTIAPFILTQKLMPRMTATGRIVNVSSAAQAPVNPDAMAGRTHLEDMEAYAQSKLAITMWTNALAGSRTDGPILVAVNPGSLLASKMVKEGFGVAGSDLGIGADILTRAALSDEFADANGKYFDNDAGQFGPPHADALDPRKCERVVAAIEQLLAN
ncbi:MAG: SDR family NAD(P)-dependent oxidoreductase, partial [Hyphomicrobiaceae bacterium]